MHYVPLVILIIIIIGNFLFDRWIFDLKRRIDKITIENICNQMNGNESAI